MAIYRKSSKPIGLKTERFDLDKDNYIVLREIGSIDVLAFQARHKDLSNGYEIACDMLSRCIVDEIGEPIFKDGADVGDNFNVGISTFWAIHKRLFAISGLDAPKEGDEEAKN